MVVAFDADALVRAVERPDSEEGRLLDRVIAKEAAGTAEAQALAAARAFFEEHRSTAFAWSADAQFRRVLEVAGAPPRGGARAGAPRAVYGRADFVRGILFSLVVGTALVIINVRPGATTGNPAEGPDLGRIFLDYLVPFVVSSTSSALSNHERRNRAGRGAR